MTKYQKILFNRICEGKVHIGYDLYNKTDVIDILPTLPASYGIVGRIGTTLIFEVNDDGKTDDTLR